MAKDKREKGPSKSNDDTLSDPRFASVYNDPKFRAPKLKDLKIKVDDRFNKQELRKLNEGIGGRRTKIDRYGRKIKDKGEEGFDKYFEEEKDDDSESGSSDKESESEESDEDATVKSKAKKQKDTSKPDIEHIDRARGEGLVSSSEDDSSDESESEDEQESDSDSDSDSDDLDEEVEEESDIELESGEVKSGDPTPSFAVVNMDWDNIRAVDLMATFISFVPRNGLIKSVAIYPSEFGKEQMQREEIEGPPKELFRSTKKRRESESESDLSDSDIDVKDKDKLEKASRALYQEDDGEEDYDSKALRRYQLTRLRYYYAVVQCDSVQTSENIYKNCDGTEYESTANIFDLRYIPEDMEFDESEARDICTKVPANYKPNSSFVTDALHHSKVKLTWDETPRERLNVASRSFSQREIDEMDFKAYLASDSEESEQETSIKDKYKNLVGSNLFDGAKDDVDMEITFNPALEEGAGQDQGGEDAEKKEETTIEAYRRREKERRKRRMEKFKQQQEQEKQADGDESKSSKNKKSGKDKTSDEKEKAELELLMMDEENEDTNGAAHFNMKEIVKSEKQKNKKKGKKKSADQAAETPADFNPDLNDPRFNEVFENHEFAIDPTSSEFKKTDTMKKILSERSKRNKSAAHSSKRKKLDSSASSSSSNSTQVDSLVEKLKRKHARK
ncbi:Piso0_003233 [Millerozyma farinosa CBS 7064]|uniref:Piso0_003233 protein n=1 Tax=Pichia sorbitophila (strain ATCC MYA-4447 / BCRC 22081 / CBS 7064 / NBRC 10061 / NRRL Y-12695) TaxID=559304 RepID=G8YII9_PICSO|nr:Piso0_003233 [Millerozyma farinosa CBS 7064]CCE80899.1 Piso0_003233 [Millerozyma farinosa CBS 7064]